MKKILFVVLPYIMERKDATTKLRAFVAFPYGILSIATYLKKKTDTVVRIFDGNLHENLPEELTVFNPDIVAISMMFGNSYKYVADITKTVDDWNSNVPIVLGGSATRGCYEEILTGQPLIDMVCDGEGEIPFLKLVKGEPSPAWVTRDMLKADIAPVKEQIVDLDEVIELDYSFVNIDDYRMEQSFGINIKKDAKQFFVITSRNCPFSCLSGDSLIDTTEGIFKIKDLIGTTPKVLTRDPITKEPLYAQTSIVVKTGEGEQLIRVKFKDGSYIDCTRDHKFITFKNRTQANIPKEKETEAQNLIVGSSVKAIHYETTKQGYTDIVWGRHLILKRKLIRGEYHIHHIDYNKINNIESNLLLTTPQEHFTVLHPEISQRMIVNNPSKYLSKEDRHRIGQLCKGKKRTLESRLRYRESRLGTKNPNYIDGHSVGQPSRIKEVNHVVESITILDGKHDTYCMEVPGYDWFYANSVLVHNCRFCMNAANPNKTMRYASIEKVIRHVRELVEKYGMNVLTLYDDQLLFNKKRAKELFRQLAQFNLRVDCPNGLSVAFIDDEMAGLMKKAGMDTVKLAIESGSPYVLYELINKPLKLGMVKPIVKILHNHGLWVEGYFVIGMPGETDEHRKETIQFIKDSEIDWSSCSSAMPLLGTPLFKECVEKGYIKEVSIGSFDTTNTFIDTPDYSHEYINEQTYLINLDVNFVNNRTMKIGDYEGAAKLFRQVIVLYPYQAFAHYYLAKCYMKLGNKQEAIKEMKEYTRILRIKPEWVKWSSQFGLV